jgi:hypothetical protein
MNSAPVLLTPNKPPAIEPNLAELLADCVSGDINFAEETYCLGITNASSIAVRQPASAQYDLNRRLAHSNRLGQNLRLRSDRLPLWERDVTL